MVAHIVSNFMTSATLRRGIQLFNYAYSKGHSWVVCHLRKIWHIDSAWCGGYLHWINRKQATDLCFLFLQERVPPPSILFFFLSNFTVRPRKRIHNLLSRFVFPATQAKLGTRWQGFSIFGNYLYVQRAWLQSSVQQYFTRTISESWIGGIVVQTGS